MGSYSQFGGREYWFYGNVAVRDINKAMQWHLPEDGPNTIGGLIVGWLEHIPEGNLCVQIKGYRIEILQIKGNKINRLKIIAPKKNDQNQDK